jgi:hypothetical protein
MRRNHAKYKHRKDKEPNLRPYNWSEGISLFRRVYFAISFIAMSSANILPPKNLEKIFVESRPPLMLGSLSEMFDRLVGCGRRQAVAHV